MTGQLSECSACQNFAGQAVTKDSVDIRKSAPAADRVPGALLHRRRRARAEVRLIAGDAGAETAVFDLPLEPFGSRWWSGDNGGLAGNQSIAIWRRGGEFEMRTRAGVFWRL